MEGCDGCLTDWGVVMKISKEKGSEVSRSIALYVDFKTVLRERSLCILAVRHSVLRAMCRGQTEMLGARASRSARCTSFCEMHWASSTFVAGYVKVNSMTNRPVFSRLQNPITSDCHRIRQSAQGGALEGYAIPAEPTYTGRKVKKG
jgi:hypothetical protein